MKKQGKVNILLSSLTAAVAIVNFVIRTQVELIRQHLGYLIYMRLDNFPLQTRGEYLEMLEYALFVITTILIIAILAYNITVYAKSGRE